jgi:dTDP-glucose 4,6-dehydratase
VRILITGGAGFIGSHLVDHYIASGDSVVVVDNLITGQKENIVHHLSRDCMIFVEKDVCTIENVEGPIDLIMHFACPASPFDYLKYPIETLEVMSTGTENMLKLACAKKARFLLASTSEVYGDPEVHPQQEDYSGNVNIMSKRAVYDEGKRFAETLTMSYWRTYRLNTGIVRIFNTYGERMRTGDGRVVPTFISKALRNQPLPIFGDGSQTRSFCYISDMVKAIAKAAEIDYQLPIKLGKPVEYSVFNFADIVRRVCESRSELQFCPLPESDPKKRRPDISKARQLLGWSPEVDLETGLHHVVQWFRRKND